MFPMGIRSFELFVLRPCSVLLLLSAVIFIVKGMWFLLGGSILGLFYLGIIGSKLHPLQSASGLAQGPTRSIGALAEAEALSSETQELLVSHACTRVGLLFGVSVGVLSWVLLGWSWYFALTFGFMTSLFIGAGLKVTFKAR
jgi:hypothetical protein